MKVFVKEGYVMGITLNNEDVKIKLNKYMEQYHLSQAQVASDLNISKATLSLFLKGTYVGDNDGITDKLTKYLIEKEALNKKSSTKSEISLGIDLTLDLSNTQKVLEKLTIVHNSTDILLIYGPAGCGKTTALEYYYSKHPEDTLYLQADTTRGTPRAIVSLVLSTLGGTTNKSTQKLMDMLITTLRANKVLIMIDEAQHLSPKAFDTLRAVYDKANTSIVYAGNPNIIKQMYGRYENEFDQIFSRIGYKLKLDNNYTPKDIQNLLKSKNVSSECIEYLCSVANEKGGLRLMLKQYKVAVDIATYMGEDLNREHFTKALEQMGI